MPDWFAIATEYQAWKVAAQDATGLAKDALHVHVGLAAFVVARLFWRRRFGWGVAWLVAFAFATGGEWFDMVVGSGGGTLRPEAANWHDIWNTMLWPTVLALIGRWLEPRRPAPSAADEAAEPQLSGEDAEQPFEQA